MPDPSRVLAKQSRKLASVMPWKLTDCRRPQFASMPFGIVKAARPKKPIAAMDESVGGGVWPTTMTDSAVAIDGPARGSKRDNGGDSPFRRDRRR